MSGPTVRALWIGRRISTMERLAICSFIANGHEFLLYTYGPVEGVPEGTTLRDAEAVLPAAEIFRYRRGRGRGSVSAFSNCFRYRVLLDSGGWWSDLDAVCLGPLGFVEEHVMGYERSPTGGTLIGSALVKAPAGSRLMARCWEASSAADRSRVRWGEIGPQLLSRAAAELPSQGRLLEPDAFYPVDYWRVWDLVERTELPEACLAVHLWHSQWRLHLLDPDAEYDPECPYERFKRRYGVAAPSGARRGPSRTSLALRRLRRLKAALFRRRSSR